MFEKGADQALAVDVLELQALPSLATEEVAGLARKSRRKDRHGRGGSDNICLITLNGVLNDLDVLNIFGGSF